jgi:RNA-binding protein
MTPPAVPLSPAERRALKARAHALHPVVIVGSKGLTELVLKEVEIALTSHELIKIKLASNDREERASQFAALAASLAANPVQQIGKIAVLYRKSLETPEAPATARPKSRSTRPAAPSRPRAASRPPTAAARRAPVRPGRTAAPRSRRGPAKPSTARKPGARH